MKTWCMSFVCCSQTGLLRIAKENRVKLITTWQCRSYRRHSTFYCDSHFGARIFLAQQACGMPSSEETVSCM